MDTSSIAAALLTVTTALAGLSAQVNNLVQTTPSTQLAQVVGSQKQVLSQGDFSYQGYYDVAINGGDTTYMRSLTHRYVNGQLRFLTLTHKGVLMEFSLPSSFGGTANSPIQTWNIGSVAGDFTGIWWEESKQRLWVTSTVDYGNSGEYYPTNISTLTLGSNGAISNIKTVSLQNIPSKRVYGGVTAVPAEYQSKYGCGPYAVGFGGYTSLMAQVSKASLGPVLICIPDIANYSSGATIPSSSFKVLLDAVSGRGVRKTIPVNYFDGGDANRQNPSSRPTTAPLSNASYLSPRSDGLGWMVWGDSYYNTGMWIDTATKQGFVSVASLCKGYCWYQTSTLHFDDRQFELHIWDSNILGNGLLTQPTSMNELQLSKSVTEDWSGNTPTGNISGATYDSVSGKVYMIGYPLGNNYSGRVYVYSVNGAGGTPTPTPTPTPVPTPNPTPTPTNATVSSWSAWTGTTAWSTCTNGTQTQTQQRTRTVTTPATNGGTTPALSETQTATESCTVVVTPTNAIVSSWSNWTDTSSWSTCTNGTQSKTQQRTRTIVTPATNGGTTPSLSETQTISQVCTITPTPTNATVSTWSAWSATTAWSTCTNGTQTQTQQRTRTVTTPATNGGTTPALSETQTATQSCTVVVTPTVPTDATVSSWSVWTDISGWGACSSNSQSKTQQRTRTVLTSATNGGTTPSLSETQTISQACSFAVAPLHIGEKIKTTTTVNVRVVGGGTLSGVQLAGATGVIIDGPSYSNNVTWWKIDYTIGVDGWSGDDYLIEDIVITPTDAIVSAWSSWNSVTTWSTCINGTQTQTQQRTRTVTTPATNGGTTPSLTETQTISQSCTIPVTPTPTPVPTPEPTPIPPPTPEPLPSTTFVVGDDVKTIDAVVVRVTPGGDKVGSQYNGSQGRVTDGPMRSSGRNWWKVDYTYSPDGWSAEDYLAKYVSPTPNPTPVPTPVPTPLPTPTPTPTTEKLTKNLYWGMSDSEVTILQNYLIAKGYLASGNNIGYFGRLTYNAVRAFQKDNGIRTTGYVGTQTRAVINSDI